jgi:uncharacterized protein
MRCPACKREFQPDQSSAMPFCSKRCRLIDLGRWLGEDYALPAAPNEDESEAAAESDPNADE